MKTIENFVDWCDEHYLELNVKKTKEVIFDFRRLDNSHNQVNISNELVERVGEYKYLGVIFDEKLTWHSHSQKVQKKMNQRLYFLRKLYFFNIDSTLLSLFYKSCLLSILSFCINAWGGNATKKDTMRIDRCLKNACKMFKNNCDTFENIKIEMCLKKFNKIINDNSHPLFPCISHSPRSGRILHETSRTVRYFNSFIPFSIRNCDNPR